MSIIAANKEQQVKNSFIYFLPIMVSSIIPMLTLVVFTRILTKEDFGILALAQIYAIFASGLINFGLPISYERNFFQYDDLRRRSALLYSTMLFVIASFSIAALLTYIFSASLAKWIVGSSEHASLLFWAFCSAGLISLTNYFFVYFKNTENAKKFASYTIYASILGALFSLFLVAYLRIGVIGLVWGPLGASIILFCILGTQFLKEHPFSFEWPALKEALKISYPLTPKIFFGVISNQFDKYMIGLMASVGGVGIYSIGQKIAVFVATFMTAIQNVFAPQVYRRMFRLGEQGGAAVGRYLTPFVYLSISVGLLIALFAEELVYIIAPPSYYGAVDVVIVLSMFYGILFFGKQPQLIFAKKTHISSLLMIIRIVLNVGLNIPFIIHWGAIGAAWATLLAGLISGAISFIVAQKYYTIHWEYKKIGAIFCTFFAAAIAVILLREFMVPHFVRLGMKLLLVAFYVYIGIRIQVITKENYYLLRNIFQLKRTTETHS